MHIPLPDFTLAYDDRGAGQPVLFIHGYPLSRRLWTPQVEGLSHHIRIIAPDLRGHGESNPVPGPYSVDMLAGDCAALLDALGVNRPVIVCGLSMGGYVALAFMRSYPLPRRRPHPGCHPRRSRQPRSSQRSQECHAFSPARRPSGHCRGHAAQDVCP